MTRRGVVYLIFLALILLAALATGFREIFYVVFCLTLVFLSALASALLGFATLRCRQNLSYPAAIREETIGFKVMLQGLFVMPVWVSMRLMLPNHQLNAAVLEQPVLTFLGPGKKSKQLHIDVYCPHRGAWKVGVSRLRVQDVFGFFALPIRTKNRPYPSLENLTIYPFITELAGELPPAPVSPDYDETISVTADYGDSFSGTRQYRSGDSLKRIHWIQSVRTQQLYTRQYDISVEQFNLIMVDTLLPPASNVDGCGDMLSECAASLSHYYVLHGQPVRLTFTQGDEEGAAYTMEAFEEIHSLLATVPFAKTGEPFFPGVLTPWLGRTIRSVHVLTHRPSRELLEALRPFADRHCRISCIIPPSPAAAPLMDFAQETGIRLVSIMRPDDIAAKLGDCL